MLNCPACKKPVNIYATTCPHCAGALTPASPAAASEPASRPCCAKCGHAEFAVVSPFNIVDVSVQGRVTQMAVATVPEQYSIRSVGNLRLDVYLACGHAEWFASGLPELARLAGKVTGIGRAKGNLRDARP